MKIIIIALLFLISFDANSLEEERLLVKQCQYVSGIAMNVQVIRQSTGHTFTQFLENVDKIYQEGEGLDIIKGVAYKVYEVVAPGVEPDDVFTDLFEYCIEQGQIEEEYF